MLSLLQDLRFALRFLGKTPGFTAVALITLAIGIGANTAVFSVVDTVLLRPLPYDNANDIVALWEKRPKENQMRGPVSAPDFVDWRRMAKSFSNVAAYDTGQVSISQNGDPERVPGARVTSGFFEALGTKPRLGRTFQMAEEQPGRQRVAMISDGLWRRRFGADASLVGKPLDVNGEPFVIVGVLPAGFRFPFAAESDLFVPIVLGPDQLRFRGIHQFGAIARLKRGIAPEQAQAEMDLVSKQLEAQFADSNTGHMASVIPLHEEIAGKMRPALKILLGAVFLVVLIACANIANLLLARAAARRKELSVRVALGCSRRRLIRQSFTESFLLAICGAGLGILLAMWGLDLLRSAFFHRIEFFTLAGLDNIELDGRVLLFTIACTIASTLFFGISPALAAARVDLNEVLRSAARGTTASDRQRFRSALVIAEVALSLVLLSGAGLLAKSFVALLDVNPGFQPEHLVTAGITLPRAQYPTTAKAAAFYDLLLDRAKALPGAQSVGITDTLPLTGDDNRIGVEIAGRAPRPGERLRFHPREVSMSYLRTMAIPLVAGRGFEPGDATARVAIVSETAAKRYWTDGRALGQRFRFGVDMAEWIEVIGIAGAVHNRALDEESTPDVYIPFRMNPYRLAPTNVSLVVRTGQDELSVASSLRALVNSVDRTLPVSSIRSMETYISDSIAPRRFNLVLLGLFAAIALALAAAGLYGVMAYLVSQRTSEIGIRMALGARQSDVLRLVIGKGLALAGVGAAIGLAAALAVTRFLGTLLFGVTPRDPVVLTIVPVLLIVVAALASYIPARRASNVDPMSALRAE